MYMKWWTGNLLFRKGKLMRTCILLSLCFVMVTTAGCSLLPDEQMEEEIPVITPPTISKKPEYEVRTETIELSVKGSGKLMSQQEESIYFTEDGLHIKDIKVKAGDKVAAGAVIAVLDVEDLEKQLRKKRLDFRKQEIQMKETLRTKDEMDPIEFEEASIVFEEQRQELVDMEQQIGRGVLTTPFAGTIISVSAKKGDTAKAYEPIAVIADTSNLVVAATFSKEDQQKVGVGMVASVDINGSGVFTGKVKVMPVATEGKNNPGNGNGNGNNGGGENGVDQQSLEKYLIVQLDKTPDGLERGRPLSVKIVTERREKVVLIPIAALRSIGSRTYVQVVEADGSKREVDVEVGLQTSTDVEIIKGLTPGQKVVGR